MEHFPYSPDLAPCDIFLFHRVKAALKGIRLESVDAVKSDRTHEQQYRRRPGSTTFNSGNFTRSPIGIGEGTTLKLSDLLSITIFSLNPVYLLPLLIFALASDNGYIHNFKPYHQE